LYGPAGAFTGTVSSSDPDRVRLSADPKALGTASVTSPATRSLNSVYIQGMASEGTATISLKSTDGRTATFPVYLFPSTWVVRDTSQSGSEEDVSTAVPVSVPLTAPTLTLALRPLLVEPATGLPFSASYLSIRGGSDPFFLRTESSDTSVVAPVPPDALLNEGDSGAGFTVRLKAHGSAMVNVIQPDGFVPVPTSGLAVSVFTPSLAFGSAPLLSTDLQLHTSVRGVGDSLDSQPVKLTSLDPAKLLLSPDGKQTGQASITTSPNGSFYLQALSTAQPGDVIKVRLEAAPFATTEAEVRIVPAELHVQSYQPLTLSGGGGSRLDLQMGPAIEPGRLWNYFSGGVRPGVPMKLRVTSSDPAIVSVPQAEFDLTQTVNIPLTGGKPGQTRILVDAPASIVNRAAAVEVVVNKYWFSVSSDTATRYLRSPLVITNPRAQAVTATVSSGGTLPLRYAETASGTAAESLTLNLAAKESRTFYVEAVGMDGYASLQANSEDFVPYSSGVSVSDPRARFGASAPPVIALSGGSFVIPVLLGGGYDGTKESVLGSSFGPLDVEVQSSNPQVVRVNSATVRFLPGESRRSISIDPVGKGDAVISLILPAGFSKSGSSRDDLLVTVK